VNRAGRAKDDEDLGGCEGLRILAGIIARAMLAGESRQEDRPQRAAVAIRPTTEDKPGEA
jgi:hypothetical protein